MACGFARAAAAGSLGGLLKKLLKALAQREAERLDMAPELMLRKKVLEALLKTGYPNGPYQLPDSPAWLATRAHGRCLAGAA